MAEGESQPLRTIFMGTPDFAVPILQALEDDDRCDVTCVVSQPDRPAGRGRKLRSPAVIKRAKKLDLDCFQPENLDEVGAFEHLKALDPQLIVVAAYGQILRARTLELPTFGCINVHASLLPRWRGAAPIHQAIRAGDAVTGVSIMKMNEGLDTGPVYSTQTHMIRDDETAGSLHDALAAMGADLLIESLAKLMNPDVEPTPQPDDRSTYAPMFSPKDHSVRFDQPAQAVVNQINGMSPWPGVKANIAGESVGLEFARLASADTDEDDSQPGEVITADAQQGLIVACANGTAVRLERLKRPGKRSMKDTDCLNGFDVSVGTIIQPDS